ncbi:DUF342 domain-containing protein [Clostridium sp. Mt-5]|uniref:DUF342 domain-containing protein n=1 Tax=Clostridium moutaii TaxID=3240932 RepID=A0ABV4BJ79_9CLOT
MKKIFQGISLEDCLKSASYELHKPKDKLKYKILKQKKSFFKKKTIIEVFWDDGEKNLAPAVDKDNNLKINENNGTAKVLNGKIIVKDPVVEGKPAVIYKSNNISIFVDGVEVENKCEVFDRSDIKVIFTENDPKRELNIYVSDDKMKAYAEIKYTSKNEYALKDMEESPKLSLKTQILKSISPTRYTVKEIKEELSNNKVVYGIIEENLKKVVEISEKVLVARGKEPVNGQDDLIESKFKTFADLKEDLGGNVDFKSIGVVNSVKKGDIIALRHEGTQGENGYDVNGKILKHKKGKRLKLKVGMGCTIKDENTVEAAIDGKPSVKGNTFYVHQVHEISGDVDLSTGSIRFMGDIVIHGSVKEGMEVECGNDLVIDKEVERASINATGNISVGGSVVASKICGGGDNVKKINAVEHLEKLNKNLTKLIDVVKEIKSYNLLGRDKKDGEIIKILLESKFKVILKLSINVIADLNMQDNESEKNEIIELIRTKLMGMGPISIENYSELNELMDKVKDKIKEFKDTLALPVNVNISYCQDSDIKSSGDIIMTGRGEYISNITGNGFIEFLNERSVARGGILKSKIGIKCKTVGSTAGVSTILQVESHGDIWADVAYHNTVFKVGNKEMILDSPSKNVHAYLKEGLIVVDKFVL